MSDSEALAGADETFDLVIVGSGGGSMCAALVAASRGLKPLILEKTAHFGGTTAKSGGVMWIPNNRFMREDGVKDSPELALTYLEHTTGKGENIPGATPERRRAYVKQAPRMVEFLIGEGIELRRHPYWPDYHSELPGASLSGRTVFAKLFDARKLGKHREKLRPNYIDVPLRNEEMWDIALFRTTWKGKRALAKVAFRTIVAKISGAKWVAAGAALQGRMFHRAIQRRIDMRTNARVERLLRDDEGRVRGVVVTIDGRTRTIAASRGVLVNAGGFARNQDMRDRYQPGTSSEWTATCEGDTGEMILEMMRIGANVAQMDEMVGNQAALPPVDTAADPSLVVSEVAKPHSIVVDQGGSRYLNESQSYMTFCQEMLAHHKKVPAVPSWLIMDSQYMAKYMVAGSLPGSSKPDTWFASGWMKKADTLADLAHQCAIDPHTLEDTVARFNRFAEAGVDEDYGRGATAYSQFLGDSGQSGSPSLATIAKGPFFAYKFYPGDVGTYGGVVTDPDARVLREDGTPIDGLYATGISTASVMGRCYPGAGASVGPSFVWGFVAAEHAAGGEGGNGRGQRQ